MAIRRSKRPTSNFYHLNKSISEDLSLTWDARGLLIFLLGKPDHWKVSVAHLVKQTASSAKPVGKKRIYSMLKELEDAGYVRRESVRSESGKFDGIDYVVSEHPVEDPLTPEGETDEPDDPERHTPERHTPERHAVKETLVSIEGLSRTDNQANTDGSKTHVTSDDDTRVQHEGSSDYTDEFEQAWKEYPKRSGANNKRAAFKAWSARIRSGVAAEQMLSGVRAYSKLIDADKTIDRRYVMMASTFFGPNEKYKDFNEDMLKGIKVKVAADHGLNDKDYNGGREF